VIAFQGETWVPITWLPGALPPATMTELKDSASVAGTAGAIELHVTSSAWITVVIDHAVEAKVLAAQGGDHARGVAYDFAFMGSVSLVNAPGAAGAVKHAPPLRRVVSQQRAIEIRNSDSLPKPPSWADPEEAWLPRKVADSFESFDTLADLQKYMKGKPATPFAILQMPDGRWGARPLDERTLQRLADNARRMAYNPEQFEKVQWYKNQFAEGRFQGLFVDGLYYRHLSQLADRYFDDPFMAAITSTDGTKECEVFAMGPSSYGRKPLAHKDALARWAELSQLDWPTVQHLETEPKHRSSSSSCAASASCTSSTPHTSRVATRSGTGCARSAPSPMARNRRRS